MSGTSPGRVPPFYCPYCGDEDIRPYGEDPGDWRCGSCTRVWQLRYRGVAVSGQVPGAAPAAGGPAR